MQNTTNGPMLNGMTAAKIEILGYTLTGLFAITWLRDLLYLRPRRMAVVVALAVVMDSFRTTSTDLKPRNSVVAAITEVPTMPTKAAPIIIPGLTIISTGPLRVRNRKRVSCVSQCRRRTNMGRSGLSLRSIGGVTRCNSRLRTEGMS